MNADTLWDLTTALTPLSFGTIGGGVGVVADVHRVFVQDHLWLSNDEFVSAYAISRLAPGPGSLFVTLLGWQVAGLAGAIVATLALFLPTSLLIAGTAAIWSRYRGARLLSALESGLRPVAAGLILAAVVVLLQALNGGWIARGMALTSAALLIRSRINPILMISLGAAVYLSYHLAAG